MQWQVNQRTAALQQQSAPWNEAQLTEQQQLAQQQQHLAQLVLQLLQQGAEQPKPEVVRPPPNGLESLDKKLQLDASGKEDQP